MRKFLISAGVPVLLLPPLLVALSRFHVNVVGYIERSLILAMAFAIPLIGVVGVVAAVVCLGTTVAKMLEAV